MEPAKYILLFAVSISLASTSFGAATKNPPSLEVALCSNTIAGLMLPETEMAIMAAENEMRGLSGYARLVSLQGFIEANVAHKFLNKTNTEMEKILTQVKEIDARAKRLPPLERQAENTLKQNLLRIYSNYVFLKEYVTGHIKTKEEIAEEFEEDKKLDEEFGIKKPLLN